MNIPQARVIWKWYDYLEPYPVFAALLVLQTTAISFAVGCMISRVI